MNLGLPCIVGIDRWAIKYRPSFVHDEFEIRYQGLSFSGIQATFAFDAIFLGDQFKSYRDGVVLRQFRPGKHPYDNNRALDILWTEDAEGLKWMGFEHVQGTVRIEYLRYIALIVDPRKGLRRWSHGYGDQ